MTNGASGVADDANSGTTAVREGFGFDQAALTRWLDANIADFSGPLSVEQFRGGQSNPTYKLIIPVRPMCCGASRQV